MRALLALSLAWIIGWLLTLWSGPYLSVVAGIVIGGAVTIHVYKSEKRPILAALSRYEGARKQDRADVLRVQSTEVVVIDECFDRVLYAFQADENQVVFIAGPISDEGPTADFPNTDFSAVSITDSNGEAVIDWLIHTHGEKLEPIRFVSSRQLSRIRYPDHKEVIQARLDDLEQLLAI